MKSPDDAATWEPGWEAHELAQLRRLASLPLSAKLQWLEEAHALVRHLSQQRRPPASSADTGAEDSTPPRER